MTGAALVAPWRSDDPLGRAIRAGLEADRLGVAFLGGYRAAVEALVPAAGRRAALLATEEGPVHPRSITTRLDGDRVSGRKRFATGVPGAERFVVLAVVGSGGSAGSAGSGSAGSGGSADSAESAGSRSAGGSGGRGDRRELVAVVVPADAPGITIHPMPTLPFVPEVPHAEVVLDAVEGVRVPGDGWADVVKPFRTVEDVHVLAAVLAYLIGAADRAAPPPTGFGQDTLGALAGALAALVAIGRADPGDPAVHVALAGVLATIRSTVADLRWPGEEGQRWDRDRPLLEVAERARAARLAAAWGEGRPAR